METLLSDVRYALRLVRKSPGFALTACLSIAIGVAASTAIFGLADALLLRARAGIADPGQVVDVGRAMSRGAFDTISYPDYADYRDRNQVFTGIAAYRIEPQPLSLDAAGDVDRIYGTLVSDSYFSVLGVRPARGRLFETGEDHVPTPLPLVVLSHRLWQERFAADPAIVGATIRLNSHRSPSSASRSGTSRAPACSAPTCGCRSPCRPRSTAAPRRCSPTAASSG